MHSITSGTFHEIPDHAHLSRSRTIKVSDTIDITFVCYHPDHAIADLIDHTFTNIFATFSVDQKHVADSFSKLLEDLNTELAHIQLRQSLNGLSLFAGIVHNGLLTFSLIGDSLQGLLVSSKRVDDIFEGMSSERDLKFVYDSSGQIGEDEFVIVTSTDLMILFSENELLQLANISWSKRTALIQERVKSSNGGVNSAYIMAGYEKAPDTVEMPQEVPVKKFGGGSMASRMTSQALQATGTGVQKFSTHTRNWFMGLPERAQYIIFGVSIVIALFLLYTVISTALSSQKEFFVPKEYEDMYAQAVVAVNEAINSSGNPEAFQEHIQEARSLLTAIQERGVLKAKVEDLNTLIASREKQFNQITTASSFQIQQQYDFGETGFDFLQVFVYNGQQYYLGKNAIIGPHIIGSTPETHPLPDGAKALFGDIDEEGHIYVYTDNQQIIDFYKGNYQTLQVEQIGGWDKASAMQVYNDNIYILSQDGTQIYKHRKVGSGYDGKSLVIQEGASEFGFPAASFDIDGGFYIFKENALVDKVFSSPTYERRSIVINNLGTNIFGVDDSISLPQKIIADPGLNYVFLLLNGKVWIFQPNSNRYADVKALNYIGQIEVPDVQVQDMWIAQDGDLIEIYIGSSQNGVYRLKVSILDGDIEIKS